MGMRAAACAALGIFCATTAGTRRVAGAGGKYSAELPLDWASAGTGKDAYQPKSGGAVFSGIDVIFLDEGNPELLVKSAGHPSKELRAAKRIVEFHAQPVERRGPWLVVETFQKNAGGEVEFTLHAARPAPGGYYAASFWAATAEGFKKGRPAFERWLDTFKLEPKT